MGSQDGSRSGPVFGVWRLFSKQTAFTGRQRSRGAGQEIEQIGLRSERTVDAGESQGPSEGLEAKELEDWTRLRL